MAAATLTTTVDVDSPLTPDDLRPAELVRLSLARPESVVMLEQRSDGRFNIHGNAVITCYRCGNLFIGETGMVRTRASRHLSLVHDESHPLLPKR